MLPPHIWAAVFSQLEDPFDRTALAVVSKTTARIAADTYRQSVPSTVCQRPIQLRAVAMEARQAFKHRKAEVFVDIDSANNLWGLAHLETLQVLFAHMREYADDRQGCLTICIPESVTKLACACQVPTAPGDERPPDLFLIGLEHLQNLKMLLLSDQGDCVGLTVGGMEGLSALQNLQELRIAKASVSGVSAMQHSAINSSRAAETQCHRLHSSVLDHGFHTVQTIDSGHFVEELMPCADPSMCQQPPLCLLWVELYVKESVAGPVPA